MGVVICNLRFSRHVKVLRSRYDASAIPVSKETVA